jgi:hypothetical protein
MFTLLHSRTPVARKHHRCTWCNGDIPPGLKYVSEASVYCGDFQYHKYHNECRAAALMIAAIEGSFEFTPGEFKRGTMESL